MAVLVRPGVAGTHVLLGALVGLALAPGISVFGLATQRLARETHSIPLVLFQNAMCALVLVPALAFVAPPSPTELFTIALLGIVSLEPVYAIAFAAALFGEAIDAAVIVSAALIVGASLLLLRCAPVPAAA